MTSRIPRNAAGSGVNPNTDASGVNGRIAPSSATATVVANTVCWAGCG
jgi:hypothetical protein